MPINIFTISGNVGVAGATVSLTGTATASTTSGSDGSYTFGGLGAGSYTVTPSSNNFSFSPVSEPVTITSGSVGSINFGIVVIPNPAIEIHEIYDPIATATNVLNINANIKSPGTWTATGQCAPATIEQPDNKTGSNSVVVSNQGSKIVLGTVTENNQVQKTVNGRYDKHTVINNPA